MQTNNQQSTNALLILPKKIEQELEDELNALLAVEADEYHNDLVPFSQHEKSVREKGKKFAEKFCKELEYVQNLLKGLFEAEEKNSSIDPNAQFARLEESIRNLPSRIISQPLFEEEENRSLQEKIGLSWPFMDRAYQVAKKLQEEKRYEDAFHIFRFLRILNHLVFDYFIEEANCLFELKKINEALEAYGMGLALQPENHYLIYKIGLCLFQLDDLESSQEAFDHCIESIQENKEHEMLLQNAKEAKALIQKKKMAA